MSKFLSFVNIILTICVVAVGIVFTYNEKYDVYALGTDNIEINSEIAGEPPEWLMPEYCLRDEYIIYAQNQDRNGLCWDFAATMAASTTIMKKTNEYYDFSELWTSIGSYEFLSYYDKVGAGGSFSYLNNVMKYSGLIYFALIAYSCTYFCLNLPFFK